MSIFTEKIEGEKLDTTRCMKIDVYYGYDYGLYVHPDDVLKNLKEYMDTHPEFKDKAKELFK